MRKTLGVAAAILLLGLVSTAAAASQRVVSLPKQRVPIGQTELLGSMPHAAGGERS